MRPGVTLSAANSGLSFAEKVFEELMEFGIPFRRREVREVILEWGKVHPEQLSLP